MNCIDIFAGCGGLSVGLYKAGWHGIFAVEKNKDAFSTLEHNLINKKNHFNWPDWLEKKEHDINELIQTHSEELKSLRGQVDLVAGGPPCQGFSMAGKRNKDDLRNKLVNSYISFIELVQPKAIIFENVHGFTVKFKDENEIGAYSTYVSKQLQSLGYNTKYHVINVADYGVPQTRRRFILVALKDHNPDDVFNLLKSNKQTFCKNKGINTTTTLEEAIGDLKKSYGTCQSPDTKSFKAGLYGPVLSGYQKLMRQETPNTNQAVDSHRFVNHSDKIIKLHEDLLANAPKGKRIKPEDGIVTNLHRRGVTVLDPDSQAPTITSIPDELVHYEEPRILTVREHARIQSFPDWYEFKGKYTSGGAQRKLEVPRYTQVGNAVPPLFAEQIGLALLEVLQNG